MKIKKFYFDCETTGLDPVKNDIIQIAGIIEVDGKIKEKFNFKVQPFDWNNISAEAMNVHKMTIDDLKTFEKPQDVYLKLVGLNGIFDFWIDRYNKNDKFIVCGYNVGFDIDFLNNFFKKNGNNYLFSYLGARKDPLPVLNYLKSLGFFEAENLKLETVAKAFNIDLSSAHDALADIEATKEIAEKLDNLLKDIKLCQ